MKFFRLTPDTFGEPRVSRWQLTLPAEISALESWDLAQYVEGRPAAPPPVDFEVFSDGPRAEFNYTAFSILVVSERVGTVIAKIAPDDVQLIPVRVRDDPLESNSVK
jgi:hypothetical protein